MFRKFDCAGFDHNGSNIAQESSPNKESNKSSDDFSADELSTSKKMAQDVVFHVDMAPEDVLKQDHMINQKISTQPTQS